MAAPDAIENEALETNDVLDHNPQQTGSYLQLLLKKSALLGRNVDEIRIEIGNDLISRIDIIFVKELKLAFR